MTEAAPEPLSLFGPPATQPPGGSGGRGPHPSFITASGTLFRCVDYDTPVWAGPNTRPGRWHRTGRRVTAQYWSSAPATAWAEILRSQGVRSPDDVLEMRMRMWAGQILFGQIADLRDTAWLTWLELDDDALLDDDHTRCQDAAQLLLECGAHGLVAPSAAIPDRLNLVLFRRLIRGDWVETPAGPMDLRFPEKVMPCHLVSYGHPPPELVHRVRYRGT